MRNTNHPCNSEAIEPAMAHIIGHLYAQFVEIRNKENKNRYDVQDALVRLWQASLNINRLSILTDTPHFSVSAGNELGRVARLVQEEIGYNPLDNDKDHELYPYFNF